MITVFLKKQARTNSGWMTLTHLNKAFGTEKPIATHGIGSPCATTCASDCTSMSFA